MNWPVRPDFCKCGHRRSQHDSNGEWCQAMMDDDIHRCRCPYFKAAAE